MNCFRLATISCCFVLACASRICRSEPPDARSSEFQHLEDLTVTVGDVSFHIDGPKRWTLSGINYQKTVLAVEDSAYGTVVGIRGAGYLGSAHFLDVPGKPGEVEKEDVTRLELFLDDAPLTEFTPTMKVEGRSFRMKRKSRIRKISLDSSLTVRDDVLVQSVRLHAEEPVDLNIVYPLMFAWTPTAEAYLFGDDNGVQKRGVFLGKSAQPGEGLEKTSRWIAVYDSESKKGAVCYVVQRPDTADAWLQFTDAPGVYRKLRLMSFVEQTMPAGFDGTYQTAIGFLNADENDWEAKALQRVGEMKVLAATLAQP